MLYTVFKNLTFEAATSDKPRLLPKLKKSVGIRI